MNLNTRDIVTRKEYTSHYPVLIVGAASSGKSRALENMSAEDKKRTMVLNFDVKPLGNGTSDEFYAMHTVAATAEVLTDQIKSLSAKGKKLIADGKAKDDPQVEYIRGMVNHLKDIKNHSYFVDDVESVDRMIEHIHEATFNPDIDRIVTDTLTANIDFCEAWARHNFSNREIWAAYGQALQRIMQAVKEATTFGLKYSYTFAHMDIIPASQYDTTPKEAVKVKGGIMSGNVEQSYSTVVFTHLTEDGKRLFECSNLNTLDTSRTKLVADSFKFERHSLDDLEQLLSGNAEVVDEKIVLK